MYAGDDVGAMCGDFGSRYFRVGPAGCDLPNFCIPSCIGALDAQTAGAKMDVDAGAATNEAAATTANSLLVGDVALGYASAGGHRLRPALANGSLKDWDVIEKIWEYAYSECLRTPAADTPVVAVIPNDTTDDACGKYLQLLFEKLGVPAAFLFRKAVSTAFSTGRSSCLVVDSGAQISSVVPVVEGFALQGCMAKSMIGGDYLDNAMLNDLDALAGAAVRPRCAFRKVASSAGSYNVVPNEAASLVHSTVTAAQRLDVARDAKETWTMMPQRAYDEALARTVPAQAYELPDGSTIQLGTCRFSVPELLMSSKNHDVSLGCRQL